MRKRVKDLEKDMVRTMRQIETMSVIKPFKKIGISEEYFKSYEREPIEGPFQEMTSVNKTDG